MMEVSHADSFLNEPIASVHAKSALILRRISHRSHSCELSYCKPDTSTSQSTVIDNENAQDEKPKTCFLRGEVWMAQVAKM